MSSSMKFKFGVYSSFGLIVFSVLKGQTDTYQIEIRVELYRNMICKYKVKIIRSWVFEQMI